MLLTKVLCLQYLGFCHISLGFGPDLNASKEKLGAFFSGIHVLVTMELYYKDTVAKKSTLQYNPL